MDCCDRFTLTSSGCSFCRYCGVYVAYDDDTTMPAVKQVETPATTVVLPPSARDKRSQQSSNIKSLKKGGAGEMWFCYEAGASVEVAPEEALLTTPLATAASVEPEALPAVLHARTCARGAERREGAAAPSQSQGCWARDGSASNRRARKCADLAARVGAARRCQCRWGLGTPRQR